jgi:hypothetical protein
MKKRMIAFSLVAFSKLSAITLQSAASISDDSGFRREIAADTVIASAEAPKKSSKTSKNKWRMFDPNAMKDSNDLWMDIEALFWQSNMGSLDYGVTSKSTSRIDDGHVKHPHFDWDYGVRVGLGYKLPHDKWDIFVNYTYVHGHAHSHAGGSGEVVFPTWATNFTGIPSFYANSAKAHWKMNLNMGDIELGRNCFVSNWLTIRPFMGVRGLVIDQEYTVQYRGGTVAPLGADKMHLDTDFWGVGIRFGADTLWGLGRGFSIYGNGSASLLSGDFTVKETEKLTVIDLRLVNAKRHICNVVAVADLALGLQWDYMLSKDRYHFGVKFGWELDMFFDQNQLFNFGSSPGSIRTQNDDLSFQGLTLGFRFDF